MDADSEEKGGGDSQAALLRIGDVAKRADVSRRTVDFYTTLGLIQPAGRTPGNYRLYKPDVVDLILLVRRLEEQGVALAEVADALQSSKPRDAERQLRELDGDLHRLRRAVHGLSAAGGTEASGVVSALVSRLQTLVDTAMEVTAGPPPPV